MSDNKAKLELVAVDKTRAAFDSAKRNLSEFKDAASRVNGIVASLGIASAVGAGTLAALAKSGIDTADAFNDLSSRTGVSVKTLADWQLAATLSDTSIDALGRGVQKLTLSIGEAERGSKEQAVALQQLGVTARDPQQAFEQLADAVAGSNDPIKTNAALQKVLGKSYTELLPLLQGGAQGLRDSAAASATFSDAMVKLAPDASKFNDQMDMLKVNAAGASATILAELLPSFNEWIGSTDTLIERHGVLVGLLASMGAAIAPGVTAGQLAGSVSSQAFTEELEKAKKELSVIESTQKSDTFGLIQLALYGSRDEMERKRAYLESQISTLESSLNQFRERQAAQSALKGTAGDNAAQVACVASGGTWDGQRCVAAKSGKAIKDTYAEDLADAWKAADDELKQYSEDLAWVMQADLERDNSINAIAQEWTEAGRALKDEMITPLEEFDNRLEYINELWRRGAIDIETYDRAMAKAFDDNVPKLEKTKSIAEELGMTFTSAFEDAIVNGEEFGDVLKGLEADLARLIVRKAVTEPLMQGLSGFNWGSLFSGATVASANGNVFMNSPGLSAYSGSVVDSPTVFPFAAGMGLMGEAGPEAILPLKRGANGKLGIEGGGGGVVVNVINNASGAQATASERQENGVRIVDVMIEQVESAMSRRLGRGEGMAPVMERRYGLNPGAGAY